MNDPIIGVLNAWGTVRGALERAGAVTIDLDTDAEVDTAMPHLDALVLTGGSDVDPARYNAERDASVYDVDEDRDAVEFRAVRKAREARVPMLGICRGHQLLNVAYGGTLLQDIPQLAHQVGHLSTQHTIKLRRKTRIAGFLNELYLKGTSLHHQAVDRFGDELLPAGWAPDGVVEMLESAPGTKPYVLGTQFHPEYDQVTDPAMAKLFKFFVGVAKARSVGRGRYDERFTAIVDMLDTPTPPPAITYIGKGKWESDTTGIAWWENDGEWEGNGTRAWVKEQYPSETCNDCPCPMDCDRYGDCAAKVMMRRKGR